MMMLTRLLREHDKLRTIGADLAVLVSSGEPCDLDELVQKRCEMTRTVHQHLAYEERQVLRRLRDDPDPLTRRAVDDCVAGIEQLHIAYRAHVTMWTTRDIATRWPDFQKAVKTLIIGMRMKLDREERLLFPLVTGIGEPDSHWRPGTRNWAGDGIAIQAAIRRSSAVCDPAPLFLEMDSPTISRQMT
ncbi:hemerythrin domain-containing protein [Sphingomonas sp. So64.6b]|uniref:hemerythrin domain-containing protein n=1 Tax=Sphingomonas sp. So64.6b TaxID=2997354 RepID=UPI001603BA26|nr:hemerythrin domain-containing protein [Sphingomonas sp. So64.6b]QNA85342.1 hemerythrin domain-containing protein [Sphingomonas sp. So64.6b]